jgi:4-hydroxy-tetrahydrodipicolinate synthase
MEWMKDSQQQGRRELLKLLGAGAIGVTLGARNGAARPGDNGKRLTGIFPIAQTPFTDSDKLDVDSLTEELRFIDRGGVHGFVWPQLASEWDTLTEAERLAGAEAIGAAGKKLRPAVVLGVQGPNAAAAVKYAKHAEKVGADAIISLPPAGENDPKALLTYYKEVGGATKLPMFVQAVGQMSVDTILGMYRAVPTLRYLKDEAGQPLERVGPLREGSHDELKVFTGGHGKTLIDEMIRGFSGSMPAASFADIYAAAWNLWHEGRKKDAIAAFGNAAVLINEISAYADGMKYVLHLRGVFPTYHLRPRQSASGGASKRFLLDDTGKQVLRQTLELMKVPLRA